MVKTIYKACWPVIWSTPVTILQGGRGQGGVVHKDNLLFYSFCYFCVVCSGAPLKFYRVQGKNYPF